MSEALAAVFPLTTLQTCIVHLIRHSFDFANWTERKPLAAALGAIYTAPSAEAAGAPLDVRNITAKWKRADRSWKMAMRQFAILCEDRFTAPPSVE